MKRNCFFFLFLLFFAHSCQQAPDKKLNTERQPLPADFRKIDSLKKLLRSGDLIFRNGIDEVSRAARSFNRKDTSYSHCGLVLVENGIPYVYHALGGVYNPDQKLMRQPVDSFANPAENNAVGAWRYELDSLQEKKLNVIVQYYYLAGLKFDLFFNFKTDDRMYCAEFVYKSLRAATDSSHVPFVNTDTIPFGVTTDDLFLFPKARIVAKEKF